MGPTLDSILTQDYRGKVSVIVADGSDDLPMRNMVRSQYPRVDVISNPLGTIPCGLNRAIEETNDSIIVRCDSHTILPVDYISRCVGLLNELADDGVVNVGGRAVPVGSNLFGRAVARAVMSPLVSGNSRYKVGGSAGPVDSVYLGAFRRESWERVGGYNEFLGANEDYELNWRLRQAGGVVWFEPDIQSTYRPRDTPLGLARQGFGYGRWKATMLLDNPRSVRMRQLAPPLMLAAMLATVLTCLLTGFHAGLALWPALYLALTGIEFAREPDRCDSSLLLLPLVIFIMHMSWASGFFFPKMFRRKRNPNFSGQYGGS